jgi:hypothetical protein
VRSKVARKECQLMTEISLEPQLIGARPNVIILGDPDLDLAQDIISLKFCANTARCKVLEVLINNWGNINNQFGYKYSGKSQSQGGDPIQIGVKIKLSFGTFTMAVGNIITLAPNFPEGSPPTLCFSVDAHRPRQKIPSDVFTIEYGGGLREFHPILHSGHSTIQGFGIADGSPKLIAGIKLKISNLGDVFNGTYSVTESTHTFDIEHGYQTSFACVKNLTKAA